jgi:hypothetical protein
MAQPWLISMQAPSSKTGVQAGGSPQSLLDLSSVKGQIEEGENCAYNETKECFLGLHVATGDFPAVNRKNWLATLTPSSGAGLWMLPFRGIQDSDVCAPLDLLYLDADARVIETVEFFPTFHVSPSSPPAASVLALPAHSIFSSQTQPGDRLLLCTADELVWRLGQAPRPASLEVSVPEPEPATVLRPVLVRERPMVPVEIPAPVAIQEKVIKPAAEVFAAVPAPAPTSTPVPAPPVQAASPPLPSGKPEKARRGWLERWLFPEPDDPRRKAPRQVAAGLTAHFFTGGAPQAHEIRDISATGLFVVTTERWYPGTIIRMTLSKPDFGQDPSERSITVHAKSVRWGNDGVGLEFLLEAPSKRNKGQISPFDPVDSNRLQTFLKGLTGNQA